MFLWRQLHLPVVAAEVQRGEPVGPSDGLAGGGDVRTLWTRLQLPVACGSSDGMLASPEWLVWRWCSLNSQGPGLLLVR